MPDLDQGTLTGLAVLVSKLGAFALLIHASRRASRAVRESEARRQAEQAERATAEAAPLREAA